LKEEEEEEGWMKHSNQYVNLIVFLCPESLMTEKILDKIKGEWNKKILAIFF